MTTLEARDLLASLQDIENEHGRVRGSEHWGPRTLDLDLLVYGKLIQDGPQLILPHPGIRERNFVLLPFAEIAPDVVIPGLESVAMLASKVNQSRPTIEKLAS